jgi:hypothetical protein
MAVPSRRPLTGRGSTFKILSSINNLLSTIDPVIQLFIKTVTQLQNFDMFDNLHVLCVCLQWNNDNKST